MGKKVKGYNLLLRDQNYYSSVISPYSTEPCLTCLWAERAV